MKVLKALKNNKFVMAVVHTFWQSFAAVFLVGILPIVQDDVMKMHYSDAKTAVWALVIAALAAGLSAVKNYVVYKRG